MVAAGFPFEILLYSDWLCWQNQLIEISNPISRNAGSRVLDYKRKKVGKGETHICGGMWKVNWLSELYSCIHHNFASRITQTLAVVEPMFCHLLSWCISVWRLKSQHSLLCRYKRVFLPTFCSMDDKCGNTDAALSTSWEPRVGVPWIQGSWSLPGSLQDPAHQEHSVWANMQILGSANTNTVNYTQQKHTQQPGSHMIDIMLWLCCGTFIFIGKHFRQQFRFT